MKKIFKRKRSVVPQEATPDIVGMISEVQRQLAALERKVDSLISQSSSRPSERPFRNRSFGRSHGRGRQDQSFRERSMTQVICADCGKDCEVPFKPSADRPVYCRECFAKRKGGGSFGGKHDDSYSKENREFRHAKKPSFRRRK